nr:ATP-dependent 6-phosphofructokinase 6-like isoform X2 [Tanacetum cinerariifolium]
MKGDYDKPKNEKKKFATALLQVPASVWLIIEGNFKLVLANYQSTFQWMALSDTVTMDNHQRGIKMTNKSLIHVFSNAVNYQESSEKTRTPPPSVSSSKIVALDFSIRKRSPQWEGGYIGFYSRNTIQLTPKVTDGIHKCGGTVTVTSRGFYSRNTIQLTPKVTDGIHKCGGTVTVTSRGDYNNQKLVNSIEDRGINQVRTNMCPKKTVYIHPSIVRYLQDYNCPADLNSVSHTDMHKPVNSVRMSEHRGFFSGHIAAHPIATNDFMNNMGDIVVGNYYLNVKVLPLSISQLTHYLSGNSNTIYVVVNNVGNAITSPLGSQTSNTAHGALEHGDRVRNNMNPRKVEAEMQASKAKEPQTSATKVAHPDTTNTAVHLCLFAMPDIQGRRHVQAHLPSFPLSERQMVAPKNPNLQKNNATHGGSYHYEPILFKPITRWNILMHLVLYQHMPTDQPPACAMSTDELMSAAPAVSKRVMHVISILLHQNPRKDKAPAVGGPPAVIPGQDPPMDFSMKIMCSLAKIRAVIGTTRSTVSQMQQETGTNIHVCDASIELNELVICVSSLEYDGDKQSRLAALCLAMEQGADHIDVELKIVIGRTLVIVTYGDRSLFNGAGFLLLEFTNFFGSGNHQSKSTKGVDDQGWGTFDNNDDVDSVWGFNSHTAKM